jgi:hypothetical protein
MSGEQDKTSDMFLLPGNKPRTTFVNNPIIPEAYEQYSGVASPTALHIPGALVANTNTGIPVTPKGVRKQLENVGLDIEFAKILYGVSTNLLNNDLALMASLGPNVADGRKVALRHAIEANQHLISIQGENIASLTAASNNGEACLAESEKSLLRVSQCNMQGQSEVAAIHNIRAEQWLTKASLAANVDSKITVSEA